MAFPLRQVLLAGATAVLAVSFAGVARADIPADYIGKPYKGAPQSIPGRIELADLDLGGEGVAYHADHRRSNSAGYEPISGNDYRPDDKDLPNICKTNGTNPDVWADDGTTYPSDTDKYWYYMGYAHAVDWVKVTVDVKAAGKYYVSSWWASAGDMWGLSIWFNDGHGTPDPMRPKDGVNKTGIIEMAGTSDYHKWKKYPNFATVDLSAGLQVMTFHLEKHDHLQYGFLQFDPVDGTTGLGGAGAGGNSGGGMGGTGGAATGGSATAMGGALGGEAAGSGGMAMPVTTTGGAGTTSVTPTGGAGSGTAGSASSAGDAGDNGGCSIGPKSSRTAAALGAFLAGYALVRRRRRR